MPNKKRISATAGAVLLVGLWASGVRAQDLQIIDTSPADGQVAVDLDATIRFTFSAPLDTSRALPALDPVALLLGPDFSIIQGQHLDSTLTELTYQVRHQPDTDYVWVILGARTPDGLTLFPPHILRYTTRKAFGPFSVSGFIEALVLVGGKIQDEFQSIVLALLTDRPHIDRVGIDGLDKMMAATSMDEYSMYTVNGVSPGVYWPVAFVDRSGDGIVDHFSTYSFNGADSVIVDQADLAGIDIAIVIGGRTETDKASRAPLFEAIYPDPGSGEIHFVYDVVFPGRVSLEIYNSMGQRVSAPLTGVFSEIGSHTLVWQASDVASGMYFCRLQLDGLTQVRSFVILR